MNQLNSDHDEARALHRVVRAMHDGECPKCHTIHTADKMWGEVWSEPVDHPGCREIKSIGQYMRCPSCDFTITKEEADAALAEFGRFMDRNLEIFLKWRAMRLTAEAFTPDC